MKNQGISLITLIITIIVIIILAAIVIFTGLRTPDSAQFSAFTNDVDTVYTRMIDKFADLKVEHAVKGDYRTNEQIYYELATGHDPDQYAIMNVDTVAVVGGTQLAVHNANNETKCQRIEDGNGLYGTQSGPKTNTKLLEGGFKLPKVREMTDSWYVTNDGRIFNTTGFAYNNNLYFNASYYAEGQANRPTNHKESRAKAVSAVMAANDGNFKVTITE